jgi:hypothetical protein
VGKGKLWLYKAGVRVMSSGLTIAKVKSMSSGLGLAKIGLCQVG